MLRLTEEVYLQMVGHCYDELPLEACGLLAGQPGPAQATVCYRTPNVAQSARIYTVDPKAHLRADRDAEARGLEIMAVFHSHTHTDAYPSATDVANAVDPGWHYVLVSMRDIAPVVRSFHIIDGKITEEPVVVDYR